MMAKILVDYKEFKRLQDVEEKYENLKKKEKDTHEQEGKGVNIEQEPDVAIKPTKLLPPVSSLIETPVTIEKGVPKETVPVPDKTVLPPPNNPVIDFFINIKSASLVTRAKNLLNKIKKSDISELNVTDDGNVYIDGKLLSGANIVDLLPATYYTYKNAVGKKEWLTKLRDLHLIRGRDSLVKTMDKEWWYIGPA